MNVEVFIYGTPTGNCFYGKTDEKIYLTLFIMEIKQTICPSK